MFVDDEDAPISIIITTLAARAYDGSQSVIGALSSALARMPDYIGRTTTGVAHVGNPVNPLENFADKWSTHPRRERCFFDWLAKARRDFERLRTAGLPNMPDALGGWVGERAATRVIRDYAQDMRHRRNTGISISAATGMLGSHVATGGAESQPHVLRSIDAASARQGADAGATGRQTPNRAAQLECAVRPGRQSTGLDRTHETHDAERPVPGAHRSQAVPTNGTGRVRGVAEATRPFERNRTPTCTIANAQGSACGFRGVENGRHVCG